LLLENGANINAEDKGGNTARDYAAFNMARNTDDARKKVVTYLDEKKAAPPRSANASFAALFQRAALTAHVNGMKDKPR
jgi:ankyrin repeat protein